MAEQSWTRALRLATLLLAGCAGHDGHALDASPADAGRGDAPPGCTFTTVTVEEATRTAEAAGITVRATLANAFIHCAKTEVVIELVLDTHVIDLLAVDVPGTAVLETSLGAVVSDGFSWTPGYETSHHRDGVLRAPAPPLAGAAWLRLTLPAVGGVDRVFEWDETLLAHDLP